MSENKPQQAPTQVPSVGRVVHFVYGDQHVPALIVVPQVWSAEHPAVGLYVMTMDHQFTVYAHYDESGAPATWHWPEHVPAK